MGFRAVREGRFDRFQCLLRPGPAAASRLSGGSESLGTGSQRVNPELDWGQALQWGGFSVRCWVVLRGTGPARAGKLGEG
jgi:hypothetical protein